MGCCLPTDADQREAWTACENTIAEAIYAQHAAEAVAPVLIDALPTLGKTTAAAQLAPDLCTLDAGSGVTYLTRLVRNREQFQAELEASDAETSSLIVMQLPRFHTDCPTAAGEYGDPEQQRLLELYRRGISLWVLHSHQTLQLPCGGRDCPYMQQ